MELKELKLTNKRLEICKRLELQDSNDVLSYYPFKYENYSKTEYKDFVVGQTVVFEGELLTYPSTYRYGRKSNTIAVQHA